MLAEGELAHLHVFWGLQGYLVIKLCCLLPMSLWLCCLAALSFL